MSKKKLPLYPATLRNRDPILSVIKEYLPPSGKIIETASATGEHIVYFAQKNPRLFWQPSDKNNEFFWAIEKRSASLNNIYKPITVDLTSIKNFSVPRTYNAVLNINMIHISPWDACKGLFELSKNILADDGFIYTYGPYKEKGKDFAISNEKFDVQLRSQNHEWGVRYLEEVIEVAEQAGFKFHKRYEMPANNLSLIFKKF